jgi:hypothetical protein
MPFACPAGRLAPFAWCACLVSGMDDYRDLVSAALALFCAGVMLVAGHLLIEWHARHAEPGIEIEAPKSGGSPSPLLSNGSPPNGKMIELSTEVRRKRPT